MSWLEIKDSTIKNTWKHIGFHCPETQNVTINMEEAMAKETTRTDTGSVNDEEKLDPLAYNTCVEDSDSDTEEENENEFAVR